MGKGVDSLSDERLIALARRGDQGAFEALVRRCRPGIYAVAYRLTLHEDDALDVTQEVSFALCDKIDQLREDAALEGWLRRMTINRCLSLFRRRQTERRGLEALGREAPPEAQTAPTAVESIQRGQDIARVEKALGRLSQKQRLAFSLRFFEDRPLAEIAELMGTRVGTVKSHLFRATHKLREILAPVKRPEEEPCR